MTADERKMRRLRRALAEVEGPRGRKIPLVQYVWWQRALGFATGAAIVLGLVVFWLEWMR